VTLSPYTRLSLAELADRLADDDTDAAATIRAALAEDADDDGTDQDTGDADAARVLDTGAVWADAYARASATGAGPALAARRADAAAADARRIRDRLTAEGNRP